MHGKRSAATAQQLGHLQRALAARLFGRHEEAAGLKDFSYEGTSCLCFERAHLSEHERIKFRREKFQVSRILLVERIVQLRSILV